MNAKELENVMPALNLLVNQTINSIEMLNKRYDCKISLAVSPSNTYVSVDGVLIAFDDWSI